MGTAAIFKVASALSDNNLRANILNLLRTREVRIVVIGAKAYALNALARSVGSTLVSVASRAADQSAILLAGRGL
jgi:translation initiation factor 2B subunit (eIF-2B alpha/beta/delta family)